MKITKPRRRAVEPPGTTSRRRRVLHHFLGLSQARTSFTRYRRCISLSPCSSGRCAVSPTVLVRVESYSAGRRRRQAPCLAAQSISTRFEREVSARRRRQRRTQTVSHGSAPRTHVVTALRAGAPRTFRAAAAPRARRRADVRMNAPELCAARRRGSRRDPGGTAAAFGRASVARGRSKPLAGKVGPPARRVSCAGAGAAAEGAFSKAHGCASQRAALSRARSGPEPAKGCFASVFTQLLASACESQHTAAGGRARRSPLCWLAATSDPKNDLPTSTL